MTPEDVTGSTETTLVFTGAEKVAFYDMLVEEVELVTPDIAERLYKIAFATTVTGVTVAVDAIPDRTQAGIFLGREWFWWDERARLPGLQQSNNQRVEAGT